MVGPSFNGGLGAALLAQRASRCQGQREYRPTQQAEQRLVGSSFPEIARKHGFTSHVRQVSERPLHYTKASSLLRGRPLEAKASHATWTDDDADDSAGLV